MQINNEIESAITGVVRVVHLSPSHSFRKFQQKSIMLLEGQGVEGDAHMGATVKHRSRVARDPRQPNLRQVHLIHEELHEELHRKGFEVQPGEMGENITTRGIPLLNLPTGTQLHVGSSAIITITGLRNPCQQLNALRTGLMETLLVRNDAGQLVRKAGVMGVVAIGGMIRAGDIIRVELPADSQVPLQPV